MTSWTYASAANSLPWQVLTQAKKMGKERISSQEISAYTNINATQIRRDLSAFGKFGKRGVDYSIDSLR